MLTLTIKGNTIKILNLLRLFSLHLFRSAHDVPPLIPLLNYMNNVFSLRHLYYRRDVVISLSLSFLYTVRIIYITTINSDAFLYTTMTNKHFNFAIILRTCIKNTWVEEIFEILFLIVVACSDQ